MPLERKCWELLNLVRHIIVVVEGKIIEPDALPAYFFDNSQVDENSEPQISSKTQMRYPSMEDKPLSDYNWTDLERAYVLSLLEKNKWNISKAARISGLNRSTFNARLNKLGVSKR